jgi:hypothetical protein
MKINKIELLVNKGIFTDSEEYLTILAEIKEAVKLVTHPYGSRGDRKGKIKPIKQKNGVKPIKEEFVKHLLNRNWRTENHFKMVDQLGAGPIDAVKDTPFGTFAVEWETGNISSSHRALNKIAIGILQKNIIGGILVVPDNDLAYFLTDRVGNWNELEPYFVMYKALEIEEGVIGVISILHDAVSLNVPTIPKGSDGNAKKAKGHF